MALPEILVLFEKSLHQLIKKNGIKMIEEKEKQKALVERIKRHIKYLEKNDPNHVTLQLLKERISDYISEQVEI